MAKQKVIIPTKSYDLQTIYWLFDEAIEYQKRKGFPVWPDYDKDTLDDDIRLQRQFKILIDDDIAAIFTILNSDPIVWRKKNEDRAVYLHRVVVNPNHKGKRLFGDILTWTEIGMKNMGIKLIRMDTWADNDNLVKYYGEYGFEVIEYFTTPNSEDLPIQQRGNNVVLLEYQIK